MRAMLGVVVDLLHGEGEALMKHNKSSRGAGREKETGEGLGSPPNLASPGSIQI